MYDSVFSLLRIFLILTVYLLNINIYFPLFHDFSLTSLGLGGGGGVEGGWRGGRGGVKYL